MQDTIELVGNGTKARLVTQSSAVTAPIPTTNTNQNVLRLPEQLPIVLAGPIVRRVDTSGATFWMASSIALTVRCTLTDAGNGSVIGMGEATSIKLGDKLFINLVTARTTLPANRLLSYNF